MAQNLPSSGCASPRSFSSSPARRKNERSRSRDNHVAAQLERAPVPIDDLFFSRSVTGASWSPDGKEIVFGTNTTGRINLWKVAAAGGWPVQLAVADDRQFSPVWSRRQVDRLAAGPSGNEAYDLYAIPASGGAPVNLTNTPNVSETSALFRPIEMAGARVQADGHAQTDIAVLDLSTKSIRNLTNEKTATAPGASWPGAATARRSTGIAPIRRHDGRRLSHRQRHRPAPTTSRAHEACGHKRQRPLPDGKTLLITRTRAATTRRAAQRRHEGHDAVTSVRWEANSATSRRTANGSPTRSTKTAHGRLPRACERCRRAQARRPEGVNGTPGRPSAFSSRAARGTGCSSRTNPATCPRLWVYDLGSRTRRN